MHVKTCGVMSINKVFRVNTLLPSQSIWGKGPVWVPPPNSSKTNMWSYCTWLVQFVPHVTHCANIQADLHAVLERAEVYLWRSDIMAMPTAMKVSKHSRFLYLDHHQLEQQFTNWHWSVDLTLINTDNGKSTKYSAILL